MQTSSINHEHYLYATSTLPLTSSPRIPISLHLFFFSFQRYLTMNQHGFLNKFFDLPPEIRLMIYKMVLEDELDIPLYTNPRKQETHHTGPIPFNHLQQQMVNLSSLFRISRRIQEEAVVPFFCVTQVYLRHQPHAGLWPAGGPHTNYERAVNLVINSPVFLAARHARWTVMLASDEGVMFPHHYKAVNRTRQRFSPGPDALRPYRGGVNSWLRDLEHLETIHLDVDYKRDWLDLCDESAWLWPIYKRVRKLTLCLNFGGAEEVVEKARKSRYVLRGGPESMSMERNILNHLLTLSEVC